MATKIFGWALLLAGALIIIWTLYSSYNIFIGEAAMPEIFEMGKEETLSQIGEQLQGFLPIDTIPKMLNLTVWAMLAGILIFGGAQISNLGIKLIKK
jgi:hypothetical protein